MGSLRARDGKLFIDFYFCQQRRREMMDLPDTPGNRRRLLPVLEKLNQALRNGTFCESEFFGKDSPTANFALPSTSVRAKAETVPTFADFAKLWQGENEPVWKRSNRKVVANTLRVYLLPIFGPRPIDTISRADVLDFRAKVARGEIRRRLIGNDRINHIMSSLRGVMKEAARRYGFTDPCDGIRALSQPLPDVDPFSLAEVQLIIQNVCEDYRNYYLVRFFSGLRSAEIDGLTWRHVDFERRLILVRTTRVDGHAETPKNSTSRRDVWMATPVYQALRDQQQRTGEAEGYVFRGKKGAPFSHRDIRRRVWKPLLEVLGIRYRRPYHTRHTAATLWLASGESPEWIAHQLGHADTRMLFQRYSRFVPNLTRHDGSAFERVLENFLGGEGANSDQPSVASPPLLGRQVRRHAGRKAVDPMDVTPRGAQLALFPGTEEQVLP